MINYSILLFYTSQRRSTAYHKSFLSQKWFYPYSVNAMAVASFEKGLQQFEMDKLVCTICSSSYRDPKMCPNCSEIYCGKCITDYLSKHLLCPSCGQFKPELADCTRLITELRQHVKHLPKLQYKKCRIHDLPLKYQCVDCAVLICSDCGVIEEIHRGHVLKPKGAFGSQFPKGKLRDYLVRVEECLLQDHNRHQQLNLEKQVLKSELRWCKNRLREYYEQMNTKLDEEASLLLGQIMTNIDEKQERIRKLKKVKQDITEILELRQATDEQILQRASPDNELLEQMEIDGESIVRKLNNLILECSDNIGVFNFNRKSLTTLNQVYPEYVNNTYQFDYHGNNHYELKYSEPFIIHGQQWRIKIYPNGNGHSNQHLSLFLQLLSSPGSLVSSHTTPQQYYFRLELISLNTAGKTISKQYRSPFAVGDCWGYNTFVKLSELDQFISNGQLIFVVGIRNCSYFDVCKNMRKYIEKLEMEKKLLQELLADSNMSDALEVNRTQNSMRSSRIQSSISNIIDSD